MKVKNASPAQPVSNVLRALHAEDATVTSSAQSSATTPDKRDFFTFAVEYAPYGICFLDRAGTLVNVNRRLVGWLEDSLHNIQHNALATFIYQEDQTMFNRALARVMAGGQEYHDIEVRLVGQQGTPRWVAASLSRLPDPQGNLVIVHLADITRRKRAEKEWMDLATQDHLTGLSNRMVFEEELTKAVKNARRYNRQGAVLYVDIDHFKSINDTFGHKAGDMILQEIGSTLDQIFRDTDTAARIGGDEFAVIMEEVSAAEARQKAKLIENGIKNVRVLAHGKAVTATVSVGVRMFSGEDVKAIEDIVAAADREMYAAKLASRAKTHS